MPQENSAQFKEQDKPPTKLIVSSKRHFTAKIMRSRQTEVLGLVGFLRIIVCLHLTKINAFIFDPLSSKFLVQLCQAICSSNAKRAQLM
ncbi:hypothetical protein [Pseudidiomarina taiwanensis]|uniref:hypothetical protein n=1 Tax=Pseudidiomarina taiwanensis TaxID=337250 RepID=UPI000F86C9F4|nr:hypothetical protein [Pseudidiomarina taiwanensis]